MTDFQLDPRYEASRNIPIHKVDEYLYIGSEDSRKFVDKYKINVVVRCTTDEEVNTQYLLPDNIKEYNFYISDSPTANIEEIFDEVNDIINEAEKNKLACLIHCLAGISRSATLVIYHLMRKHKLTAKDALERLENIRFSVCPNYGFWRKLCIAEKIIL